MTDRRVFRYKYSVYEADFDNSYDFKSLWDVEESEYWTKSAAQDMAKDFHQNHDGWEYSWPLNLSIFRTDGSLVGTFEVDREMEPVFSARKI